MELTQLDEGNRRALRIAGKCTVEHAADLRSGLLEAVESGKELVLDIAAVEDVDVTFLQLLLSTALTLERDGRKLARAGALSQEVQSAVRISGFDQVPQLATFFADEGRNG